MFEDDSCAEHCDRMAQFLRVRLLPLLRTAIASDLKRDAEVSQFTLPSEIRDHLAQWWTTLLTVLRETHNEKISLISVSLECISRILSLLMILPMHERRDLDIYSHHLILTLQYVANQLASNSQRTRTTQGSDSNNRTEFTNNYTLLLRSFLGKLAAYAFIYLPDNMNFDTHLLRFVLGHSASMRSCKVSNKACIFPWKFKRLAPKIPDTGSVQLVQDNRFEFLKIILSYLQNVSIFLSFYWHYWYICLRYIEHHTEECQLPLENILDTIPGATLLIKYVAKDFLTEDLDRAFKYMKKSEGKNLYGSKSGSLKQGNELMPNVTIIESKKSMAGVAQLNDFIFTTFKSLALWECLRDLSGAFKNSSRMKQVLLIHDKYQLKAISKIPAYDYFKASIIYNKLLQFIIFRFKSQPEVLKLDWPVWLKGIEALLKTWNLNCQAIAILCLFNIWSQIPLDLRHDLSIKILNIKMTAALSNKFEGELWYTLAISTDFELIRVIFLKLLIFHILDTLKPSEKNDFQNKLERLNSNFLKDLDQIDNRTLNKFKRFKDNSLVFNGCNRLLMSSNLSEKEESLIVKAGNLKSKRYKIIGLNFPSVSSVGNVRPSVVMKRGRYPYDVFDEMVIEASRSIGNRKSSNISLNSSFSNYSIKYDSKDRLDRDESSTNLSDTFNTWLSKLSIKSSKLPGMESTTISSKSKAPRKEDKDEDDNTLKYNKSVASDGQLGWFKRKTSKKTKKTSAFLETPEKSIKPSIASSVATNQLKTNNTISLPLLPIDSDFTLSKILDLPPELDYSSGICLNNLNPVYRPIVIKSKYMASALENANASWGPDDSSRISQTSKGRNADGEFELDKLRRQQLQTALIPNFEETEVKSDPFDDSNVDLPLLNLRMFTRSEDFEILKERHYRFKSLSQDTFSNKSVTDSYSSGVRSDYGSTDYMLKETSLDKTAKFIEAFNSTETEYLECSELINSGYVFIDYEVIRL